MKELKEFLSGGVTHYGDAIRTARRFQEEACRLLDSIVAEQIGEGRLSTLDEPSSKTWTRTGDPYMSSDVTVDLGSEQSGRFVFGLWWSRELTNHDCVVYIGFVDGPEWARKGIESPRGGRTKPLPRGRYDYMILPLSGDADLEMDLRVVMKEFLGSYAARRSEQEGMERAN